MLYYSEKLRPELKRYLISTRSRYFLGIGLAPWCPICRIPIVKAGDLHEALLTRKDCQGRNQRLIYSPYNCVLRHHVCPDGQYHTAGHGGDEVFERCARQIVAFEGLDKVRRWLDEMMQVCPEAARKALRRFDSIFPDRTSSSSS